PSSSPYTDALPICVPGGTLHRGTTAQVEVSARQRGGTSRVAGTLQHQHPGPGRRSLHGGTTTGDSEPDHEDIHVVGDRARFGHGHRRWYRRVVRHTRRG